MIDLNEIKFIGGINGVKDVERDRIHYSFVGLKRDPATQDLQFWLPIGFQKFDNTDFDVVKGFFFSMYRTFKNYINNKSEDLESDDIDNQRDGVYEQNGGFAFKTENNEEVVLYSKLNALDKILEGYDELKIAAISQKNIRTDQIDYSKIHNYLHKAIYLEDNVAFIDEMRLSKEVIIPDSPPVVQLFCFIYCEIKKELGELNLTSDRAIELNEIFKENYLSLDSSLFEQDTFQDTILVLKETLDEIIQQTPYKDEDFWHFYDAIEAFLYGENDFDDTQEIYWGISNFYDVWEDMCQYYMLNYPHPHSDEILYADINGWLKDDFLRPKIKPNPFYLTFSASRLQKPRVLRPDLVYYEFGNIKGGITYDDVFEIKTFDKDKHVTLTCKDDKFKKTYFEYWTALLPNERNINEVKYPTHTARIRHGVLKRKKELIIKKIKELESPNNGIIVKVIDYKYMPELAFIEYNENILNYKGENKVSSDIHKQLVYEWTIQKNFSEMKIQNFPISTKGLKTLSEFWIPYYTSEEDNFIKKEESETNEEFDKSGIKVYKVNFNTLQKNYITQ
jgi:hypothetical protein